VEFFELTDFAKKKEKTKKPENHSKNFADGAEGLIINGEVKND